MDFNYGDSALISGKVSRVSCTVTVIRATVIRERFSPLTQSRTGQGEPSSNLVRRARLPPSGINLTDTLSAPNQMARLIVIVERRGLNDTASLLPWLYQSGSPHPH